MKITNENLLKKLQKSGLSDKEALIYVTLLELGGAYPSKIAEYTGLNRSTVYMVLLQMSVKGLVNEIEKKNKQFYQVEKPNQLLKYIKNKVSIAEEELERAKGVFPEIEGLFSSINYKPKVTYFDGIEGVLSVYETHINVDKPYEMLAWANVREVESLLPKDFFKNYINIKKKKGISSRGIFPDTNPDKTFIDRSYAGFRDEIMPNIRFMPADKFPYEAEITVYGEKNVSIINLRKKKLTGVIIEDETIHGLMKMIFELSWKALGK